MTSSEPKMFYICDLKACGEKCPNRFCYRTSKIEHAATFRRNGEGFYEQMIPDEIIRLYLLRNFPEEKPPEKKTILEELTDVIISFER